MVIISDNEKKCRTIVARTEKKTETIINGNTKELNYYNNKEKKNSGNGHSVSHST